MLFKCFKECDSNTAGSSSEQYKSDYFLPQECKNNNFGKPALTRPNALSPAPPAPPQRKYLNNLQAGSPSLSSFSATSSSDDEKKRASSSAVTKGQSGKLLSRPAVAPKPKNLVENRSSTKEQRDSDYDRPNADRNSVEKVAWRLAKLAAPFGNQSDSPSWSRQNPKTSDSRNKELEAMPNLFKGLETYYCDDVGSSSPSSSGIVADASDSATDYPQSSSNASEHDSAYDYPRTRPDLLTKFARPTSGRGFQNSPSSASSVNERCGSLNNNLNTMHKSLHLPQFLQGSTSVLQNVFDDLDRNRDSSNTDPLEPASYSPLFGSNSNQSRRLPNVPTPTSGNINQGSAYSWQLKTPVEPKARGTPVQNDMVLNDDVANTRKRAVCAKLSDNYRILDMSIKTIEECTAPQAWRQPHVLQQHLLNIKESAETIVAALSEFLDAASRIAVDPGSPKIDDLKRLLNPLRNSYSLVSQLKQNLDHSGWTLATLARPRTKVTNAAGNDALDQFVAVVKQVPVDCHKMLQWVLSLVPSTTVCFLVSSPKDQITSPYDPFGISGAPKFDLFKRLSDFETSSDDSKRCSLTSTITASSSSDVQIPLTIRGYTSFPVSISNQGSFAHQETNGIHAVAPEPNLSSLHCNILRSASTTGESRVIEEDDLESVLSDRESLSQDYGLPADELHNGFRKRPLTNGPPTVKLSSELTSTLSEDDRQLLRFYAPQLESHIDFLSRSIEEFLSIVEEQLPPREFVQKGKLIILAAHKLIYIGDNIAQCVSAPFLTAEAKKTADRLCCVLKNCVQATKNAADKYPEVSAVQAMVDSIVTVSHAAHDLKLLVKQCC